MYLELVNSYRTTKKYGEDIKPRPPASETQIAGAEARLGTRFPKELRAMLLEMDGDCDFLLSLEEIIEYNEAMPSERFAGAKPLFVATDGAGAFTAMQQKTAARKAQGSSFGTMRRAKFPTAKARPQILSMN